MNQKSGSKLLSTRNVLGVMLVAGIGLGLYLGDLFKGFGGGSLSGIGIGDPAAASKSSGKSKSDTKASTETTTKSTAAKSDATVTQKAPASTVVKVVIADRSYFIRSATGDEPADLKQVIAQAKEATGDENGIRIRIYRKLTSRTTAENELSDALIAAGVTVDQTIWVPTPID